MFASQFTSTVDIQEPTATNSGGSVSETWSTTVRGVPAEVVAKESMTTKQAAGVQAQTSHLVTMRYRSGVTSRCRLKLGTRYLNILGPPRRVPEARPVKLVMECMEVES